MAPNDVEWCCQEIDGLLVRMTSDYSYVQILFRQMIEGLAATEGAARTLHSVDCILQDILDDVEDLLRRCGDSRLSITSNRPRVVPGNPPVSTYKDALEAVTRSQYPPTEALKDWARALNKISPVEQPTRPIPPGDYPMASSSYQAPYKLDEAARNAPAVYTREPQMQDDLYRSRWSGTQDREPQTDRSYAPHHTMPPRRDGRERSAIDTHNVYTSGRAQPAEDIYSYRPPPVDRYEQSRPSTCDPSSSHTPSRAYAPQEESRQPYQSPSRRRHYIESPPQARPGHRYSDDGGLRPASRYADAPHHPLPRQGGYEDDQTHRSFATDIENLNFPSPQQDVREPRLDRPYPASQARPVKPVPGPSAVQARAPPPREQQPRSRASSIEAGPGLDAASAKVTTPERQTTKSFVEKPRLAETPPPQAKSKLKEFAQLRQTHALIKVVPNCGHSHKIPMILKCSTNENLSRRFVLVVQPTDQAAAFASQYMQKRCNKQRPRADKTSMSIWLDPWTDRDLTKLSKMDFVFISARQMLSSTITETLFKGASWIVIDEVHFQSADQELALAVLRDKITKKTLGEARVAMLSEYAPSEFTGECLLPQSETIDMGHLSDSDDAWRPRFKFSMQNSVTQSDYFEFLANILTRIQDGPILVIVSSASDIEPLIKMLKEENVHKARKKPWKHRVRHLGTLDQPESLQLKDYVTISLPFYHTQRTRMGYNFVICPHWVVKDRLAKELGKDMPHVVSLARSEISFLASHASTRTLVSCTKEHYNQQIAENPIPLVQQTDPIGYYLQAHVLFPNCAQYEGLAKSLPLRLFHPREQIFWAFHRFRVGNFVKVNDASIHERVTVTETGKSTASHMIQMGLTFEWAAFLQYLHNSVYHAIEGGRERAHQGLVQIGLPLALTSTLHMGRVLTRTTESATAAQMEQELLAIVKDEEMEWAKGVAYGDLWCEAMLLSLHLETKLSASHGGWRLELPDTAELKRRYEHAIKSHFKFTAEPHSLKSLFSIDERHPALDEGLSFVRLFVISIAASRLCNLARVKYDNRVEARASDTGDGQLITGSDIGSSLPVYIAKDSIAHCAIDPVDLEKGQGLVYYSGIEAGGPISDQAGDGPVLVISGITNVSDENLDEVFHSVLEGPRMKLGTGLRGIIGYPFR